ncbi:MAG: Phosphatidylinositol 4-kinase pik1alpha (PI4-kinase)(PtdIns-4-kinase) [Piccolia ochrophora]|nr:MAG: Phosphatidylinositol 4-kinase pik1alpha (PI4-kinase)(PtdIns-4-kinase) [Piccolia ochrophora]
MSWALLKRFIESDHFNNDPFLSVAYLARYADHVGIHYVLCSKLRQFSYEEIEFFLPQLCHLLISIENESMSLEEFILDLCEESVNGALLTFWLFQTYLHDLASNPQSNAFRVCRRVYNKVQQIVFGSGPARREKIKENILPVTVLASFVLASVAVPSLPRYAGPLAIAQARKPQFNSEIIADASQMQKPTRSQTVASPSSRPRKSRQAESQVGAKGLHSPYGQSGLPTKTTRSASGGRHVSASSSPRVVEEIRRPARLDILSPDARLSSSSLPDIRTSRANSRSPTPSSAGLSRRAAPVDHKRSTLHNRTPQSIGLSPIQKVSLLRSNYFRSETQFLAALEDISNRLVTVPKPARLSALRAELALIAQDLPAEIDIPVICPASLPDGAPGKSRHHRIVRMSPAEATVLNSAERVPYLLMVEVLREDFDFDPDTEKNGQLIDKLVAEQGSHQRRIFDLSDAPLPHVRDSSLGSTADSLLEPSNGDLGTSPLMQEFSEDARAQQSIAEALDSMVAMPSSNGQSWTAAGQGEASVSMKLPPEDASSQLSSKQNGPGSSVPGKAMPFNHRQTSTEQFDYPALATHMRTAAQMLAQLDSSSAKRPREEVAAIKSKIIASMQSLEEQNFEADDGREGPTFESIMAIDPSTEAEPSMDGETDVSVDSKLSRSAGAARMENDSKTGGVERRGDRDDPSAATFGEEWKAKRDRIKKSSPYGLMRNWDLLSVIVKTGADLRQEAFACQLIQVCWRIWQDGSIPVWVKQMRILVTGESCGLIETITNGVSLHSIKRSLTLATIAAGKNPRGRIATLKEHFVKSFGSPDTPAYKSGEDAFARSLAAYSMISYILQLKDRHNGNVLIDNHGHIIHIDFGFMLSNSPGSVGFEAAPFKLTQEYIDVLGGVESPSFENFKKLCKQAFQALRKSADSIVDLVDMMGKESKMPCFAAGVAQVTTNLRQRFQLQLSQDEAENFVETDLIGKSLGSYYTRLYDSFQYRTQGIY